MSANPARAVSHEEALEILMQHAVAGTETVAVPLAEAAGHVLAEAVQSEIDMPRFDRAAMDGYACRHDDSGERTALRVVATIAAGDPPGAPLGPGECARIMTGAPVPPGADAIVPVEESSSVDAAGQSVQGPTAWVRFHARPSPGDHIAPRGQDLRAGASVLAPGHLIRPQSVSILASVGRATVQVFAGPSIAYAATGEELVEPGHPLAPGQIYNSNAATLRSQILRARGRPHYLGILRDHIVDLRRALEEGLNHDLLVLSGGVSAGQYDFVPGVLAELGVDIHFHTLRIKPGRPVLFGTCGRTLVFGLPGNPISTLYTFDLYVTPLIRAFRHHPHPLGTRYRGELTETVRKAAGRLLLQPCRCEWDGDRYLLTPIQTHGSADIFAIAAADVLALIPAGVEEAEKGKSVFFRKLHEG